MPSRQMAFQISELEYKNLLRRLVAAHSEKILGMSPGDWIDKIEVDPKGRQRLRAALLISTRLHTEGVDPLRVKKIVCWRDDKGAPGEVQAELHVAQ